MKTSDPVSVSVSRNLVSVQHRTPDSLNIVRIRSDRGERETPDLTRVQRVSGAVVPSATSDEFEYRLPADSSIALDADSAEDARIAVTAIGHVLDELHRSGQDMVTSGVPTGPPWIRRLEAHLRELRCAATEVDEILRREIPAEYFDLPLMPQASSRPGLLHGAPSLASVYLTADRGVVLTGEDLSIGPPETDWGFLIGELGEIALFESFPIAHHCRALSTIIDTHTAGLDRRSIMAFAQHRSVLHVLDYADTFVATADDLTDELFTLLRSIQWDGILP